jgi:hypothetical protein
VLATHFAHTDRRALSQAWYSALHLAAGTPRPRTPATPATRSAPVVVPRAPRGESGRGTFSTTSAVRTGARDGATSRGVRGASAGAATSSCEAVTALAERRLPKSALARHIERGIVRRSPVPETASFVVRAANGRVHLVVRCGESGTRVVAVCAPPLRERVERALAQARFALAGCGVRAEGAS